MTDPVTHAVNGDYWVMDRASYDEVVAACREAGAVYPGDKDPEPATGDLLYGLPVEVRDDGGAPHLERK